jgi:hypothetical protein
MELSYENYCILKDKGLKRVEIANEFGIPEWKLKKHIANNKWGKQLPIIEFEDVFSDFDEYSCYWAGFLAADGNVDSKNRIRLMLKYDDISHLEKFKEYLGSTHIISSNTDTYNRCSFEFTNKKVRSDLEENFFIIPNKTDKLEFPSHISAENIKHYIRGYFDGDGSVCESFSNKNSTTATLYATFASGCKGYSITLMDYLRTNLDLKGNIQDYGTKWQLKFNTNDAKVLLTWMYKNSNVFLTRKYNKYVDIVVNDNRTVR